MKKPPLRVSTPLLVEVHESDLANGNVFHVIDDNGNPLGISISMDDTLGGALFQVCFLASNRIEKFTTLPEAKSFITHSD